MRTRFLNLRWALFRNSPDTSEIMCESEQILSVYLTYSLIPSELRNTKWISIIENLQATIIISRHTSCLTAVHQNWEHFDTVHTKFQLQCVTSKVHESSCSTFHHWSSNTFFGNWDVWQCLIPAHPLSDSGLPSSSLSTAHFEWTYGPQDSVQSTLRKFQEVGQAHEAVCLI